MKGNGVASLTPIIEAIIVQFLPKKEFSNVSILHCSFIVPGSRLEISKLKNNRRLTKIQHLNFSFYAPGIALYLLEFFIIFCDLKSILTIFHRFPELFNKNFEFKSKFMCKM